MPHYIFDFRFHTDLLNLILYIRYMAIRLYLRHLEQGETDRLTEKPISSTMLEIVQNASKITDRVYM